MKEPLMQGVPRSAGAWLNTAVDLRDPAPAAPCGTCCMPPLRRLRQGSCLPGDVKQDRSDCCTAVT